MDFRKVAASWLVAQCEPLVPTLDRAVTEKSFLAVAVENPQLVSRWFGAVIADHVLTLPPADPWRNLSARAGESMVRGRLPKPPPMTGAVGPHGRFGGLEDCTDVVPESFTVPATDPGLAAVASGISAEGAAVLAFGADGWLRCADAADAIHAELLGESRDPAEAGAKLFGACVDAARWSIWRRRAYLGQGDDWTVASGFAWLWRAEQLATGGELGEDEWAEARVALEREAIDPGTYEVITGS